MNNLIFKQNSQVRVKEAHHLTGVVVGGPVLAEDNLCYPVKLHKGFFSADGKTYVSVLLVNQEGLEVVDVVRRKC